MKTKKVKQNEVDVKLFSFLSKINPDEILGSKTKKLIQHNAEWFLNNGGYNEEALFNGYNVHNMLLCMIYDSI